MKKFTVLLALVLILVPGGMAQQVNQLLEKADQAYAQGYYNKAILNYIAVLGQDPKNKQAIIRLGDCSLIVGDTAEAINYYTQAITLYPKDLEAYQKLGNFYVYAGKEKQALEVFRKAYQANNNNPRAMALMAVGYLIYAEPDSAQALIDQLQQLSNKDPEVYIILAQGYEQLEKYDQAIAFISKAINLDPINDEYFFKRAKLEAQAKYFEKALNDINKAITLNPNNNEYYLTKMSIYYLQKDYKNAENYGKQVFNKVQDSNFYYLTVYAMWLNNEPRDSVFKYLDNALKKTNASNLWYVKGLIYSNSHDYALAADAFSHALEKQPWNIDYNREYIANTLVANSSSLDQNMKFKSFTANNLKTIRKNLKNKHSRYYFPSVRDKIASKPLSASLEEYLHLYLGPAFDKKYNPLDREINYTNLDSLLTAEKYDQVFSRAYDMINKDPGNIAVYNILTIAYYNKGNLEKFRQNYTKYLGLAMAVMATGSGENKKQAMISASQIDEIIELSFLGYDQLLNHDHISDKKHEYNIYQIARNGSVKTYYFLTDLYWSKVSKK